jgi:hypothetical protein
VPRPLSRCAPIIDDSTQNFEERGSAMDLVYDDQLARLRAKE